MNSKVLLLPVIALAVLLSAPTAALAEPSKKRSDDFTKTEPHAVLKASATPRFAQRDAKVNVMVQLSGDPVAVVQAKAGHRLSKKAREAAKAKVRKAQNALNDDISAKGGKVTKRLQSAYNGMRVRIQQSKVAGLGSLPGVAGVHAITAKALDNTSSVAYIGTPEVWQSYGLTGKNVKVAIIDTGIDFTHADFGGPGTTTAYEEAHATSTAPADSALFGASAPRVKGGYDFVGDDYDAATEGKDTPAPDANPLDCQGHGSHVAGTAAGSGVTMDGKTYAGPYDETTGDKSFKVGPGVAPQADLYALRVFGCNGSTDVAVDAIDWAVDHGMDVINMSLGGPFGRSSDPDAVAASNAVAAGVVVVASSGNAGASPYITGSPASGQGVISVAAVDSVATFPGASLKWGADSTLNAINANDAKLPVGSFEVVVLGQGNDADPLGCSAADFTKAGIDPSKNQIAVVTRGTCARVAKVIFGQDAGAKAVLMINTDPGFPPFEGVITSNPDDGTPAQVTIPLLGVPSTDRATVLAAAGETMTMGAISIDNPAYRQVADFSSAGPVNGDSGLSPLVAAPGVSISSAAVGSGTGAAIMSGTSMAAPHVAGVAALGVQAHPSWSASRVAAAVVGTADPEKIDSYSLRSAGAGLVDPAQVVATTSVVTGDKYRTKSGKVSEDSLSFGFTEPSVAFTGSKKFTITNTSRTAITYDLANVASAQSSPATVRFSQKKVRVPARGSATVTMTLMVPANSIGTSLGGNDQFSFRQVAGNVVLTSTSGVLRVPYLLVPRAQAKVNAELVRERPGSLAALPDVAPTPPSQAKASLRLSNYGGALAAYADVYTLGLTDGADVSKRSGGSGYDLRAAGVQSFDDGDDKLLVFAVNTHDRWSNAAINEFDVEIDTTGDGAPDWVLFATDSGAIRAGDFDGVSEVFLYEVATKDVYVTGFLAQAPTDSSTILLPAYASFLGLKADSGAFSYTVSSYTAEDAAAGDAMAGPASYDPWHKPFDDGSGATVPRNGTANVAISVNLSNVMDQKPKGLMVAVLDNQAGSKEALLFSWR